jgi:hypothetical protein
VTDYYYYDDSVDSVFTLTLNGFYQSYSYKSGLKKLDVCQSAIASGVYKYEKSWNKRGQIKVGSNLGCGQWYTGLLFYSLQCEMYHLVHSRSGGTYFWQLSRIIYCPHRPTQVFVRTLSSLMCTRENFRVGHSSQIAPSHKRLTWRLFWDRLSKKKMHWYDHAIKQYVTTPKSYYINSSTTNIITNLSLWWTNYT